MQIRCKILNIWRVLSHLFLSSIHDEVDLANEEGSRVWEFWLRAAEDLQREAIERIEQHFPVEAIVM